MWSIHVVLERWQPIYIEPMLSKPICNLCVPASCLQPQLVLVMSQMLCKRGVCVASLEICEENIWSGKEPPPA